MKSQFGFAAAVIVAVSMLGCSQGSDEVSEEAPPIQAESPEYQQYYNAGREAPPLPPSATEGATGDGAADSTSN